jgi:3-isopropylmalate/(R)-2-methylmalate dehydratase large subunit
MLTCLAMNDDKVPAGKYAVSTSNRILKDAKGLVQERLLASFMVAAAAVTSINRPT